MANEAGAPSANGPGVSLDWQQVLAGERESEHFRVVTEFVKRERELGKTIYPAPQNVFNALKLTPFERVKVVILGQDPYHGPGQAHGLCFSVPRGIAPPPSLKNIFKELADDFGLPIPNHGCLEAWAQRGVLLLNTVLTVRAGSPQSHRGKGWEPFTDRIIQELNNRKDHVIFMLWGGQAQKKATMIDTTKHTVLTTVHPSPLSAHRGFFGCRHFSRANEILRARGQEPIDWSL